MACSHSFFSRSNNSINHLSTSNTSLLLPENKLQENEPVSSSARQSTSQNTPYKLSDATPQQLTHSSAQPQSKYTSPLPSNTSSSAQQQYLKSSSSLQPIKQSPIQSEHVMVQQNYKSTSSMQPVSKSMNPYPASMQPSNSSVKGLASLPTQAIPNLLNNTPRHSIQSNHSPQLQHLPRGSPTRPVHEASKSFFPPHNSCFRQPGSKSALMPHLTTTTASPVNNLDGVSVVKDLKPPPPPLSPLIIPELPKQSPTRSSYNSQPRQCAPTRPVAKAQVFPAPPWRTYSKVPSLSPIIEEGNSDY